MLSVASFVFSLLVPSSPVVEPCDLVSKAAAGELLGAAVSILDASGPEQDEDITGAMRTVCVYMAGRRMLMVMQHTFKDAKTARDAMTQEAIRARAEDALTIKDEPGLGDMAHWVLTKSGAQYVVIKGAKVLTMAMGGVEKPPAELQAQLKAATVAALSKF